MTGPDNLPGEQHWAGKRLCRAVRDRIWPYNVVAIAFLGVVTGLSLFAQDFWLCDLSANLRVQWVVGLIATGFVTSVCRRWRWLALHVLMAAVHLPFFGSLVQQTSSNAMTPVITVTTANVFTSNTNYVAIARELRSTDAEVIAVLELSSELRKHLANAFRDDYPFSLVDSQDNGNFGIGLYSRYEFESAKLTYFNDESIQSIVACLTVNGRRCQLVATHALPPIGKGGFSHRNRHLQLLAKEVQRLQKQAPGVPVIVMGDLNLTPWSPVFTNFANAAGLQRASHAFNCDPTWYRYPVFPFGLVLDHVLATRELTCSSYDVGPDIGSDHRFVTVSLSVAPVQRSPD
jgi:endonuclease/exonuclease/phosphatase (EEP) superfamily protein YafD